MQPDTLQDVRHDLRNIVTALEYGCILIEAHVEPRDDPVVRASLARMTARLERASELIDRLRASDLDDSAA